MRVPVRVRLADELDNLVAEAQSPTGLDLTIPSTQIQFTPVTAADLAIPSTQLTLSTPLGAGGAGNVAVPAGSPSGTSDWFKVLPGLVASGAALTGAIARFAQGTPTAAAPRSSVAFPNMPTVFRPGVPLTSQPIFWLGVGGVGLVIVLMMAKR